MDEESVRVRQAFLKAIAEAKAKKTERDKREYEAWLKHKAEKDKKQADVNSGQK